MLRRHIFSTFAVVIELDRHLEILLLSNDCVIVPDFGGFMAHHVDARRDGADGMFLPPARTIGFNPKLTINDSLLAQSYVECYDISYPEALRRIVDEVRELRQHIENDGYYELHGIGVISLNSEGRYVFEPCEAGILTPSLYGLSGFEILSLREIEVGRKTEGLMMVDGVGATTGGGVVVTLADKVEEEEDETVPGQRMVMLWRTVAAACVAALIFLLFPSPLDNNQKLLTAGTINVDLLQKVLPKTEVSGIDIEANGISKDAKDAEPVSDAQNNSPQESHEGFVIVLASRVTKTNAQTYVESLHKRGYQDARVVSDPRNTKVVYGFYNSKAEAYDSLNDLRKVGEFNEAWVMKHHQ